MRTILACTLATGVASLGALTVTGSADATEDVLLAPNSDYLLAKIDNWRKRTWYWQRVMGKPRYPTAYVDRKTRSLQFRQWALELWRGRARLAKRRAHRPPHLRSWLCIHSYEGPWRANTGNGFYGGLQMDLSFQRSYGRWLLARKGRAHRWTPIEQIWVAERARRLRGWYPWPNTARACGLI